MPAEIGNYDFKKTEEDVLKFWEDKKLYDKSAKKNKGKKKFYFLDGPPYTSGRLHIGHAWNNTLKDIALRYKRMAGFDVWDRAGYDMHGLPTENAVQKKLGLKVKDDISKFGVEKFVKECIDFSSTNALQMDKDLWRLGVWMDYKNAYWPIKNYFIEGEWLLIKKAFEKNRLYKGLKVMTWCASCETALAKHELEYKSVSDNSIFLKFKVKDRPNEFLIVWTTTPWTIPFNLAVMANPDLEYVRAKVENETWILAKGLAAMINVVANKQYKIIEEFKGDKLRGLKYEHPLKDEIPYFKEIKNPNLHSVVLSKEYVDLSAGSGLVHCAPGCGPEDYEVGKEYGLPAFNNIDERAIFRSMGKFSGWIAKTDDGKFVEELKKKGALIETAPVEHDYAHCWRCHNPVVFRATEQWFMKIEDLRDKMIESAKEIGFVPKESRQWFESWINNLKDNSITRQRFWGAPVPIWECGCGEVEVIGSIAELKKKSGKVPKDLHRPWIDDITFKCKCGKTMKRVPDVLDVWIDSGTASWNCLEYPGNKTLIKKWFPADLVLEATEQIRLWFSMLHICSAIVFDKPCFKNVYSHGMILDYQGQKMSKSLGNIISPYEIVDKIGADVLRYFMCSTPAGENINFSWEEAKIKQRNLAVLWNVHKFLIDYAQTLGIKPKKIFRKGLEEKYILSKMNSAVKKSTELFDSYRLDETIDVAESLFLELSRTYIQMIREKSTAGTDEEKAAVLSAIYEVFMAVLQLLAPICPFIAEQMYLNLKGAFGLKTESVHLLSWPKFDKKSINEKIEKNMAVANDVMQAVLYARERTQLGVRWPLKEFIVETQNTEIRDAVEAMKEVIKTQTNVKDVVIKKDMGMKKRVKSDFAKLKPDFGDASARIIAHIAMQSPESILGAIEKQGKCILKIDKESYEIKREHLMMVREVPPHLVEAEFKGGFIFLNKEMTKELEAEGFSREVARRVQSARKESGLHKSDRINLFILADRELVEMLSKWKKQLQEKVSAAKIEIGTSTAQKFSFRKPDKVKDRQIEIMFSKV
jgi:isoleucyl-tRNA synthetase